jgi:ABC-2 type transport system ATP-binding protein
MSAGMAVRTRGLRKSYRGKWAVDGLELDVPRGEIFALLGPNGAGKTTTTEMLEGYRNRDNCPRDRSGSGTYHTEGNR